MRTRSFEDRKQGRNFAAIGLSVTEMAHRFAGLQGIEHTAHAQAFKPAAYTPAGM